MEVPEGAPMKLLNRPTPLHEYADENRLIEASALINRAQHPIILVGHTAVAEHAEKALTELAPAKWNKEDNHKILHIDARPADVNKLYQPDTEVIGDISYSLEQLMLSCDGKKEPEDFFKVRDMFREEKDSYAKDTGFPVKPQKLLYDVRKIMGPAL